jgi:AraC-like DNA-binding protein
VIAYHEQLPRAALRHAVECIWTLRGARPLDAPPDRILPDGCMELVINTAGAFQRHHEDGSIERQPLLMLVGQLTRPVVVRPATHIDLIGIRFQPAGARPFFGQPARELAGRTVTLSDVSPTFAAELEACIAHATTRADRVRRIEDALERRMRRVDTGDDLAVRSAVSVILQRGGNVHIERLATSFGMSERALQRRFDAWVGLQPKTLARIARFQHVFRALEAGGDAWAAVAIRCGYYDQSHLLRDFRDFAGESPAMLFAREIPITRVFTRADRVTDFS